MDEEAKQFIEAIEERFGGPIAFRTYSTWFASNEGLVREYGVFIYEIMGIFHFEDFERKPALFGFPIKPRKNQPPYVKLEKSFSASDVKEISIVYKSQALACAEGQTSKRPLNPAKGIGKFFRPLVTQVVLSSGTIYFFELINHKEFKTKIGE